MAPVTRFRLDFAGNVKLVAQWPGDGPGCGQTGRLSQRIVRSMSAHVLEVLGGSQANPPHMKAIVLTCDRYRTLTEHMIFKYESLWPDHPFVFHVPFEHSPPAQSPAIESVQSPPAIKATVLTLLEGLDDEQWVYWCIDDKYPIAFDLRRVKALVRWISQADVPDVAGVLFCRDREIRQGRYLTGGSITDDRGHRYLERKGYEQIWLHQLLRVKVLRHLFGSFPDDIPAAKAMDDLKSQVPKPAAHRLYVTRHNLAVFGESTSRGRLSQNAYQSIVKHKLTLPDWHSKPPAQTQIIGKLRRPLILQRLAVTVHGMRPYAAGTYNI